MPGRVGGAEGGALRARGEGIPEPHGVRPTKSGCGTSGLVLGRRRTSENLDASKRPPSAVGTGPQAGGQEVGEEAGVGVGGLRFGGDATSGRLTQGVATAGEELGAAAVGEEPVVADAHEALRQDVEQEASNKLLKRKREGSRSAATVVLVAKGDGVVSDMEDPVVGDRDAVGVAGQVGQDVLGAVEGRLGVDHPLGPASLTEEAFELEGRSA
jgi:hypothetical protein